MIRAFVLLRPAISAVSASMLVAIAATGCAGYLKEPSLLEAGATTNELQALDAMRIARRPQVASFTIDGKTQFGINYVPEYDVAGAYTFALDEGGEPALTIESDGSATMQYTQGEPIRMRWWVLSSDIGEPLARKGKSGPVYSLALQFEDTNHIVVNRAQRVHSRVGDFEMMSFAADQERGKMFLIGSRPRPLRAGLTQVTGRGAGAAWEAPLRGALARRMAAKNANDSATALLDETAMKNSLGVTRTADEKLSEGVNLLTSVFSSIQKDKAADKDRAERWTRATDLRFSRLSTRGPDRFPGFLPLRPSPDTIVIPQLRAKLVAYGFAALGMRMPHLGYYRLPTSNVFEAATLTYVGIQMNFLRDTTGVTAPVSFACTHYDSEGGVIFSDASTETPIKRIDNFTLRSTVGYDKAGQWQPGVYFVKCSMDGRPLMTASYDVYR